MHIVGPKQAILERPQEEIKGVQGGYTRYGTVTLTRGHHTPTRQNTLPLDQTQTLSPPHSKQSKYTRQLRHCPGHKNFRSHLPL